MLSPRTIGKIVVLAVLVQVLAFIIVMLAKDKYADKNNFTNGGYIQYED